MRRHPHHLLTVLLPLVLLISFAAHAEIAIETTNTEGTSTGTSVTPRSIAQPVAPGSDILTFLNKDRIHGTLLALKPTIATWRHTGVTAPIPFSMKDITSITVAMRSTAGTPPPSSVKLTNGDILVGRIVSLNKKILILDTPYSGKLSIRRSMLQSLQPNLTVSSVIYEGPTDISKWKVGRSGNVKSWRFKKGAFYASSHYPIARDFPNLPDRANIQFDLAWKGHPQIYFSFYTDRLNQYYGNCYLLQISGASVYLQRYTKNGNSTNLGNINIQEFGNYTKTKARINMLVDKKTKTFTLLIDGKMVKQWTDGGDFAGKGKGLLFQPQGQSSLKVSGIRITHWDGTVPKASDSIDEQKQDLIRFANNDKVSGTLTAIADGSATFTTSYATLDVPLERVTDIALGTANAERSRRNKDDIRGIFSDAGLITVQLLQLKDGQLSGKSENFGDIILPLSALKHIEFNIYKEKNDEEDDLFF